MSPTAAPDVDFGPYVPRLAARWPTGQRWLVADGTLVSADISGFTKLSEALARSGREGAEQLNGVLNHCFGGMIAEAEAEGGDVVKFGGDALLIWFTGPGHATRACGAAVRMRATLETPPVLNDGSAVRLKMSVGMHSGDFWFFCVEGEHRDIIVTGAPVTTVVRCEAAADAGQILVSHATAAMLPRSWLGPRRELGRILRRIAGDPGAGDARSAGDDRGVRGAALGAFIAADQQQQIRNGAFGEHRQAVIAFLNYAGTDALLAEHGPEPLADRLDAMTAAVSRATAAFGTHWLDTDVYPDGGKFILTAGAPTSNGHDEDHMLRTVRSIVDEVRDPVLRVGVNRGLVFAGLLGAPIRRSYTTLGDATNLAARLMQRAEPGQILATRSTVDRAATEFETTDLAPFTVKGKSVEILASAVHAMIGPKVHPDVHSLALVGRETELAQLTGVVARARRGHGGGIVVSGDPGLGKSRLVIELQRRESTLRQLVVSCDEYAAQSPYALLRVLLRTMMSTPIDADPVAAGESLRTWVAHMAPAQLPWLPLLAVVSGGDVEPTHESDEIAPEFRRARLSNALGSVFAAALREPALVVVEDAHWIDEASAEFLHELLPQLAGLSTAVVVVHPESHELAWTQSLEHLRLTPLDDRSSALLAASTGSDVSDHDRAVVVERSGGNPLFLADMMSSLGAGKSVESLPESIEALVTARIDRLDPSDRLLLRDASVAGTAFDIGTVAEAIGSEAARDRERWAPLEPFLSWDGADSARFRHSIYHRVAYEGLSYGRRRRIHLSVGDVLERTSGPGGAHDGLLSLHFARALDHDRAWRYSVSAGRKAQGSYANGDAAEFFERALASAGFVDGLDQLERLDVIEALGDVHELTARYDEAASAYADARRVSRGLAVERRASTRLLRKQGTLRERAGRYSSALRWYGRALSGLDDVTDDWARPARADVSLAYAGVRYRQGKLRDALAWATRAADDAEAAGDRAVLGHAYYLLVLLHTALATGETRYRHLALPILEEIGDLPGQGSLLNNLGIAAYFEGDWVGAADLYRRSRDARSRAGDLVGTAMSENNLAEVLSDQGRLDEAIELLELARSAWGRANYPVGVALATSNLGRAEARSGNLTVAMQLLDEAVAMFVEIKAVSLELEARARHVECLLDADRSAEACAEAVTIERRLAAEAGDPVAQAMAARLHAVSLVQLGDVDGALSRIDHALIRARAVDARFEEALCLLTRAAMIERAPGGPAAAVPVDSAAESAAGWAILDSLGVVTDTPAPGVPRRRR